MASSIHRTLLVIATALTGVGCQSGATTKAMNPTAGHGAAMLQAQAQAAAQQQMRYAGMTVAEERVAAAPDDLEARRTLAQVYFTSGRFRSAAQAYDDAIAINPNDERLRLRKALALLAQGNQVAALGELDRIGNLADLGLAYALAGRAERGIELLTEAARQPDATARTRQNLALAFALDGQWARARVIAAQDLDPATLELRVRQWAELAAQGDVAMLTAGLLAINPAADDAGRPIGIAYVPPSARPQQAAATPLQPASDPKIELAAAEPETRVTPMPAVAASKPATAAPRQASVRQAGAVASTALSGRWVVQLAAYDREELLEANWKHLSSRNAELVADYSAVRSEVTIGNRRYYRLALAGFDGRSEAIDLCENLQARGRACFVRPASQMASRTVIARS